SKKNSMLWHCVFLLLVRPPGLEKSEYIARTVGSMIRTTGQRVLMTEGN
ncbi:MAG: hypothetical protein ACI9H6_000618, partial [Patiriisocius sp.]